MPSKDHTGAAVIGAIRSIWLERRDADLLLQRPKGTARLTFRKGELYLPASHPAAARLEALLQHAAAPTAEHARQVDAALGSLVDRLVDTVMARDLVEWRLERADREAPLVGPLPTAAVVMRGSVRHLDEDRLLERLGGESSLVQARGDASLLERLPGLDPSDAFLHSRAERPISVEDLLRQATAPRLDVLRALGRLEAIDLLRVVDAERPGTDRHSLDAEQRQRALLERLRQRVRSSLEAKAVELDPNSHYEVVADRVARLSALDHYELLELDLHADDKAIHRAYDRIARLAHPSHAARLGLSSEALTLLFERVTTAYLVLMDPERRSAYNEAAGLDRGGALTAEERAKRRSGAARKAYERARSLAAKEEMHFAIELARQAATIDPKPEYLALLGRLLARNPQWFDDAVAAYRRAMSLAPDDANLKLDLAERYEEHGDLERARTVVEEVLKRHPNDPRAQGLLGQLGDLPESGRGRSVGLLARIRSWIAGEEPPPDD